MARPTIDHRGPEFEVLTDQILEQIRPVFGTKAPVIIFAGSGTGGWEAALVNTLSPGEQVVCCETGYFSQQWSKVAAAFGLKVTTIPGNWRHGADSAQLAATLREDRRHDIKAVMVVHNETSTGVLSRVDHVREAIDAARHPALLLVDAVSSIGSIEYRHDEWKVDVTVSASQKGLMLPPGLGFNAISRKAFRAAQTARLPKWYWSWDQMLGANAELAFPFTPATNLLFGLSTALEMLAEEGLPAVFGRHIRYGEATRLAVRTWGLEVLCEREDEYSPVVTAALLPRPFDAEAIRRIVLNDFDMSLGVGLSNLNRRVFRIGHLGHWNDLALIGTLGGIELGLKRAGIPVEESGLLAASEFLATAVPSGDLGQAVNGNRSTSRK
jgi:alanine-glyoxylate transaminase/serine-glyoxylate transaminase/serine-pyruvate transaminase